MKQVVILFFTLLLSGCALLPIKKKETPAPPRQQQTAQAPKPVAPRPAAPAPQPVPQPQPQPQPAAPPPKLVDATPAPQWQPPRTTSPALSAGQDEHYYIFFEAWTAKITGEGLSRPELHDVSPTLSTVLKILQDNPGYRLLIEGFANPVTGTKLEEKELFRLSTERAKEVENKFVRDGIGRERLIAVGEGGINDVYNRSQLQQAKNRRVQMTLIKSQTPSYRINFREEYAALVGRQFFAQEQIEALQQIRNAVDRIKANPKSRVLIQGFETFQEQRMRRSAPISKQRADELARLLRRELDKEGIGYVTIFVVTSGNVHEAAAEIMILSPLSTDVK
ncbi:MAG: OmpA family protein [Spirochaetaceae bacterium]|jgi:outer membrane protein OmpA-like peptidoglycan-associated protein|nr:OmpA family protein [Spirochaetaceae bacterium]